MTIENKTNKFLKKLSKIKEIQDINELRFNIIKLQNEILLFYIRVHKPHYERIIQMVSIFLIVNRRNSNIDKDIKRMERAIKIVKCWDE